MCLALAKTVNILAIRLVKQGIEAAGFRVGFALQPRKNGIYTCMEEPLKFNTYRA